LVLAIYSLLFFANSSSCSPLSFLQFCTLPSHPQILYIASYLCIPASNYDLKVIFLNSWL
jgi:hypothetical protein